MITISTYEVGRAYKIKDHYSHLRHLADENGEVIIIRVNKNSVEVVRLKRFFIKISDKISKKDFDYHFELSDTDDEHELRSLAREASYLL